MPTKPKTNFARITSRGPDGVRLDCEGGPVWVLEMAAMQLTDGSLAKLIGLLNVMQTKRQDAAAREAAPRVEG